MDETDITIIRRAVTATRQPSRVYYYQGNIFGNAFIIQYDIGRVRGIVRRWVKANRERVNRDRAHPDYLSITELFDKQLEHVDG